MAEPTDPDKSEQHPDKKNQKKKTTGEDMGDSIEKMFGNIYTAACEEREGLSKGLRNLNEIPDFDSDLPQVAGKEFSRGIIGFSKNFKLAIACGKAQVRYFDLAKFVSIIECADESDSASSIMLQNFQDQDKYQSAKGQVLARLNIESSAIHVIQGLTGRVIRNPSDIALFDVYFIDRTDLTSFYLAAKTQLTNDDKLATMISANDGWKAFDVPLDPLNPYGAE